MLGSRDPSWVRRHIEVGEQGAHPPLGLVADRAHLLSAPARRIVRFPIQA
ncbi:hypothetical protein OHA77_02825 [Streptosporangium sp. NBC_01639]|nr:hypothetical protein OHA77_02825 [Streptosporangium sp. NBC_01639]